MKQSFWQVNTKFSHGNWAPTEFQIHYTSKLVCMTSLLCLDEYPWEMCKPLYPPSNGLIVPWYSLDSFGIK